MQCEWFALCPNAAEVLVRNPFLGVVPTCSRCVERMELHNDLIVDTNELDDLDIEMLSRMMGDN